MRLIPHKFPLFFGILPKKRDKKAKQLQAEPQPGLVRLWGPVIVSAVVMMAVCGGASRVIFGFLY